MLKKINKIGKQDHVVLLAENIDDIGAEFLSNSEIAYARKVTDEDKKELVSFDHLGRWLFLQLIKKEKVKFKRLENYRKAGDAVGSKLNELKAKKVTLVDISLKPEETLAYAEGIILGNYQFLKYKKDKKEKKNTLSTVNILSSKIRRKECEELNILADAVYRCRSMVNEPVSYMNATRLSKEFTAMAKQAGMKVEVLNKTKIAALKMGGVLAVNKGSVDPPTFTMLEYKPNEAKNKNPIVFVGKGVVFDTGGMNIKTGNYMTDMKCDMAGAATMASAIYAIAMAKLPVYVVALLPATDNRLNGNAYVPGDVITMYDGTTVEVLNTDAEGRMILADALSYAKKYKPELVIDAATLTGAASRAIGKYGIVAMENDATQVMSELKDCGYQTYERIAEFPFWDEYYELIKSEVADIKNIGGVDAGMITAGKFLAHFTDYPFIHLDIAGPAFIDKKDSYRTAGGTGMGVRVLYELIKRKITVS
jgi:leucyl aminopeptidase